MTIKIMRKIIKNTENNKINMNYRQTYYRLDTYCY